MINLFWRLVAKLLANPAIADWLIVRAQRTPYQHIMSADGAEMYMGRWWLFNPCSRTTHKPALWWFPWSFRIHHIMRPDEDRDLHDHPWNARTIILRTDILNMRFDGVREGFLYVVQQKTAKTSDAAWIQFKVTDELQAVISRCRDDIVSPYLIHRRPDRKKQKQAQTKDHWTQVEERYLTRAFKEARKVADCYKGWKEEEMPGFHEVRALSLHLYQKAGKDGQKIAGHASESMTKNYQRDHAEVIWSEAIPDLNISEITG